MGINFNYILKFLYKNKIPSLKKLIFDLVD